MYIYFFIQSILELILKTLRAHYHHMNNDPVILSVQWYVVYHDIDYQKSHENLKPLVVYPSQWTLVTSTSMHPYSELNHLDSLLMYYDPDQDLESVLMTLQNCLPPSFLAVKEEVKTKIEGLILEYVDRSNHPEKYEVKQKKEETTEGEEKDIEKKEEEKGEEAVPTIVSLFKKQKGDVEASEEALNEADEEALKAAEDPQNINDDRTSFSDDEQKKVQNDMEMEDEAGDMDLYEDSEAEDIPLDISTDSSDDDVLDLKRPFVTAPNDTDIPPMNSEQAKRCCVQETTLDDPQCIYFQLSSDIVYVRWKDFGMKLPVINFPYSCYNTMPLPLSFLYFIFDERVRGHKASEFIIQAKSELPSVSVIISCESISYHSPFYSASLAKKENEIITEEQKRLDEAESDMVEFLHTKLRSLFYCRSERYCTRNNTTKAVSLTECLNLFELKGNLDSGSLWYDLNQSLIIGIVRSVRKMSLLRAIRGSGELLATLFSS